jgi:hypothetical protein
MEQKQKLELKKLYGHGLMIGVMLLYNLFQVDAQSTIPATGNDIAGSGGTVSYTVGQVNYTSLSNGTVSVGHGVQQPYEISVVTGIPEATGITLQITVYPNPVKEFLIVNVVNYDFTNLAYQLYNAKGQLLETRQISGTETKIEMMNRSPMIYFLKIMEHQREIKTFKIVKN